MHAPPIGTTGLPAQLSAFIGRAREIREVLELLSSTRVVTVTGAGGTGKTRLALEVAAQLAREHPARLRWVELAPLVRGDLLIEHVAAQLKIQELPDRGVFKLLIDALKPPVRWLVLDNCEHVIDECAELVDALLRQCDELTVLATSREALGIAGERAWLLRGLALAGSDETGAFRHSSEAVELFIDRARSVSTAFAPLPEDLAAIVRICRRLDGLPLAIELAAARTAVLRPPQIAERLDDAFRLLSNGSRTALPRHRTLRAAVDWSYEPIPPVERVLLQRLSVFAGPFTLEAAEDICAGEDLAADDVLDALAHLVGQSLVTTEDGGAGRYELLEIIRQYAHEKLGEHPQRLFDANARHAHYYARLAETALPHLERSHSAQWVETLTREYANVRAALHWSFENGQHHCGHRLVGALWWFWGQTGQWSEWRFWRKAALGGPEPEPSAVWGLVLTGAGSLCYLDGEIERGQNLLERAADMLRRSGDAVHEALVRSSLAHLLCSQHQYEYALESARIAAELARGIEEPWPLCHAMANGLGHTYACLGQYELADAYLREASEKAERAGSYSWGFAEIMRARASLAVLRDEPEEAQGLARTAIRIAQAIRDPHAGFRILLVVERLLCMLARHAPAARLDGAIVGALHDGMPLLLDEGLLHARVKETLHSALGQNAFDRETGLGRVMSIGEALLLAADELHGSPSGVAPAAAPASDSRATVSAYDLAVRCLGTVDVQLRGASAPARFTHTKPLELLAFLLCHPEGCTREQIGLAFWPDATPGQVKNNVHVLLHKLRKGLGSNDFVVTTAARYRINPALSVWFDATVFERELAAASKAPISHRSDRLKFALDLYTGEFLEGLTVGDWAIEIAERLRLRYVDGLATLADLQIDAKLHEAAIATLEQLLVEDDLREDAWRRLMLCLSLTGRREQALMHYQRLAAHLREELATDPESETQLLAARLAQSVEPSLREVRTQRSPAGIPAARQLARAPRRHPR